MSELGDVSSKPVQLKGFLHFFGKTSYFNAIRSHFACAQSHLKELDFSHLEAHGKNYIVPSSF